MIFKKQYPKLFLILACLLLNGFFSLRGFAQETDPKVYLILWHGIRWEHLVESDWLNEGQFGFGIMNVRSAGGAPIEGGYLSIGSGSRAYGITGAGEVFMSEEPYKGQEAGVVYRTRTGIDPSEIVNVRIANILDVNKQANYPLAIGSLVDYLIKHGKEVTVYGNSDTKDQRIRWAGLVGMDSLGRVFNGQINDALLLEDDEYPFGLKTDYSLLLKLATSTDADLVIIDLGDPYRLFLAQDFLLPEQKEKLATLIAQDALNFLKDLDQQLPPNSYWLLISPVPTKERLGLSQWLAPMVMQSKDRGLLVSGTTHWPGIVANIDIAPTILSLLGLEGSPQMLGRPIRIEDEKSSRSASESLLESLVRMEKQILAISSNRGTVLRWLVGLQIFVCLVALLFLVLPLKMPKVIIKGIVIALLILLTVPLALLLLPQHWIFAILSITLPVIAYFYRHSALDAIMAVALLTASLLGIDVLRGAWWIRFSYLGYDAIAGARYYGIGNEYMGILIGALIMGSAILLRFNKNLKPLIGILFLIATAIIAAPQWGTNVGGAITAVLGFGVTWVLISGMRIRLRTILAMIGLVVLVLGIIMTIDNFSGFDDQSHIGQTVGIIRNDGLTAIIMIIKRKLSMNLRLFRYSFWSRGLIVAVIAMGVSLIWPSNFRRWLIKENPRVVAGIIGTLVATITALAFNDSGVVAAATCVFFATTTMLTLALGLKHDLFPAQTDIE